MQKNKLLLLTEILKQQSDAEHPITTNTLIDKLSGYGISCDRRTLARDILQLQDMSYPVRSTKVGHSNAFYLEHNEFSLAELKILIDAVQASSVIPEETTNALIEKMANLSGTHCADLLKQNRIRFNIRKQTNNSVLDTIKSILLYESAVIKMEKCIYKGRVLYAYQVLQNFDFEQEIRSCHALTCCDCGEPVFFKHGKQRAECFAHYKREDCKYGEYCSKQSNIFKHTQRELYAPLQRIVENRGFSLEEDVIIIHDHYTAFVLRSASVNYAIDIIDTAVTSATLEKRKRRYEEAGYQYLQITVDKDAESQPFSEREMAYFPVKYSLNKSCNHTAIVIDNERKTWFIYILDSMDKSDLPDCFYDLDDWYENDTFAAPISLIDLDIDAQGFFTPSSRKAYGDFRNYRRTQKAKWLKEESDRRERQRKQAEESRRQAEIRRQEYERRLKEEEEKRRQEEVSRRAAAEAAKLQALQAAEQKRQQRLADERSEIDHIHRTTGAYVGSKIKGKYERFSLEELTASKPRNWLREYTKADFEQKVAELKEHKASAVKTLFAKLCYINSVEKAILLKILAELEGTDPESVRVIRYLMNRAGIN